MSPNHRLILSLFAIFQVTTGRAADSGARSADTLPTTVEFNRDIRPIMSNTCFKCHGPDVKNNKSDVRLDLAEAARAPRPDKSGRTRTPLVPGNPSASEVWRRITSADPLEVMPPQDTLHQLSNRDKALIKRWIEQGANYQAHWSYLAPVKTSPPAIRNPAAARNVIDQFVLARLDKEDIAPSPEADRRTLVRRLSLDLIGLPPTAEEADAMKEKD